MSKRKDMVLLPARIVRVGVLDYIFKLKKGIPSSFVTTMSSRNNKELKIQRTFWEKPGPLYKYKSGYLSE